VTAPCLQEDYTILDDARKVLENRHAVWTSFRNFQFAVLDWRNQPLINENFQQKFNIESIRQVVDEVTVKIFQLRKNNKVHFWSSKLCIVCKGSTMRLRKSVAVIINSKSGLMCLAVGLAGLHVAEGASMQVVSRVATSAG
jgi:hypothetical protein